MDKFSKIISAVFSPLLMPTYVMAITLTYSILCIVPTASKLGVLAMTLVITGIMPFVAILLLYKLKIVSDPGLNIRKERFMPYVIAFLAYIGLAFYLNGIHAPAWLVSFPIGAAGAAVVSFIVTTKWKISAHCAAAGGLIGMLFSLVYFQLTITPHAIFVLYAAILLSGIVGTSRVVLNRHTIGQVIAGVINGFVCVTIAIYLYH